MTLTTALTALAPSPLPVSGPVLALLLAALALVLGYLQAPFWMWTIAIGAGLWAAETPQWLLPVLVAPLVALNVRAVRALVLSAPLMHALRALRFLPEISETERIAIDAGDTWVDRELFSGRPDFASLALAPYGQLTPEERAFLEGPVAQVCAMTKDWDVYQRRDLPPEVWAFLRQHKFFGMIIPKGYGGLGFSTAAHSAVIEKLASRSLPLAVTVMVPNSLGPAELLIHHGTEQQRRHYLPRLASGQEIPCFALTEPDAGSDAAAIRSHGTVFRGNAGRFYVKLNWNKRYITLGSVSTVIGLAFKLHDPDNLLGLGTSPGITCALVPTATEGVLVDRRHDPLGVPFYNSPTQGRDVIVPIDAVIGGIEGVGKGWRMLMECLAAGRGISLPALATGTVKLCARVAGAHAVARKQFGTAIGRFEGVEEPLARLAGFAYAMEAARRYTCGGLDAGKKPPVVTAIVKYQLTELCRKAVNDGMDVLGGNGIARGPRNLLAHAYQGMPISITVEGANILTRTLIVFGQGAIRCHPFAYLEIEALEQRNARRFDEAFWAHFRHVVRNGSRALLLSLTRGLLAKPPTWGPTTRWYQRLAWASATFAFWADVAMLTLGGDLKRKEKLTGRFADALSWMYLGNAILRRFLEEGQRRDDQPLMTWAMRHAFDQLQGAFDGVFANLRVPGLTWLVRGPVAAWSRCNRFGPPPSDAEGAAAAQVLLQPSRERDALTAGMFMPAAADEALPRLERALELSVQADDLGRKVRAAIRQGKLPKGSPESLAKVAVERGVLQAAEAEIILQADKARRTACAVDSFSPAEYGVFPLRTTSTEEPQQVTS
jgi:acyl-CoA dehydrogenase